MFESIPILNTRDINYQESFCCIYILLSLVLALIFYSVSKILRVFSNASYFKQDFSFKPFQQENTLPISSNPGNESDFTNNDQLSKIIVITKNNLCWKLCFITSQVCYWVSFIIILMIPSITHGFGQLSFFIAFISTVAILVIKQLFQIYSENSNLQPFIFQQIKPYSSNFLKQIQAQIKEKPLLYALKLSLILILSISFIFSLDDICISMHDDHSSFWYRVGFGSSLSRKLQFNKFCDGDKPCHVYATVPHDTSTSVFINVHTSRQIDSVFIKYSLIQKQFQDQQPLKVLAKNFIIDYVESLGQRNVHTAIIQNLQPNTTYKMQVFYKDIVQREFVYKTLPDKLGDVDFVFADGGDAGSNQKTKLIFEKITQQNPQLILMGGDIAYDNCMLSCFYTWDFVLNYIENYNQKIGYVVPLIVTIGNHDIGLDAYSKSKEFRDKYSKEKNLYFTYFPSHLIQNNNINQIQSQEIPNLNQRLTFYSHIFSNIIMANIDSGYLLDLQSQAKMLREVYSKYPLAIKMATYHNPFYPACALKKNLQKQTELPKKYIIPVFDEFNIHTAFEHHAHVFKVLKNQNSNQGTIYLGDGAWGVKTRPQCIQTDSNNFLDNTSKTNHIWIIKINNKRILYQAIDVKGNIFFTLSRNL